MAEENKRKIVQLDVGGTVYKVSRDTLERCEGSMLANLISDHWKEGNSDEPIFIDRNGLLFQYVLDYLRMEKVYLSSTVNTAAIKEEFEFYGIHVDMTKVNRRYGIEYISELTTKIKAAETDLALLNAEKYAVQLAHSAESKFLTSNNTRTSVSFQITDADYSKLRFDEGLLLDRLLDRELHLVELKYNGGGSRYNVTVSSVCP